MCEESNKALVLLEIVAGLVTQLNRTKSLSGCVQAVNASQHPCDWQKRDACIVA